MRWDRESFVYFPPRIVRSEFLVDGKLCILWVYHMWCNRNSLRREEMQVVPLTYLNSVSLKGWVSCCHVVLCLGFHTGFIFCYSKTWNKLFVNSKYQGIQLYFVCKLLLFQWENSQRNKPHPIVKNLECAMFSNNHVHSYFCCKLIQALSWRGFESC